MGEDGDRVAEEQTGLAERCWWPQSGGQSVLHDEIHKVRLKPRSSSSRRFQFLKWQLLS